MEEKMNKIRKFLTVTFILILGVAFQTMANANEEDAAQFFNSYVNAANSYSNSLLSMYAPNAKIIRQVIKPNGQLANATFSMNDYKHQMIISSKLAKIRHYKNYYSNVRIVKEGSNKYKITANRRPSTGGGSLKTMLIVEKSGGRMVIAEELMQTREQILLKYAR
jgi:hypothetical protein